ncbi:MAG: hypothetical protein JO069_03345, partial [Verrucomicrobia bacterium]|nr:hypothetical protein [Verrucomicrobiota bacterium]
MIDALKIFARYLNGRIPESIYSAELEKVACRIFDRIPLEAQPKYVAEVGCGDASQLRRLNDVIRTGTIRGKTLERYPLRFITVVDPDANVVTPVAQTTDLAPLLIRGDPDNPESLISELGQNGVREQEVIFFKSFVDDEQASPLPQGEAARMNDAAGASGASCVQRDTE